MARAKYLRSPAGPNPRIASVIPIRGRCPECGSEMFRSPCLRRIDLRELKITQIARLQFVVRRQFTEPIQESCRKTFLAQKSFGGTASFLFDLLDQLTEGTEEYGQLLTLIELFDDRESLPYAELVRHLS